MKQIVLFGRVFSFSVSKVQNPRYIVDLRGDDGLLSTAWFEDLETAESFAIAKLQWLHATNVKAEACLFTSEDGFKHVYEVYGQFEETYCSVRSVISK